jgi:hypothetical protein
MPPMMPVISPFSGGTPEATAMPMQSGIATRKTTIEAVKSRQSSRSFGQDGKLYVFIRGRWSAM